jgi:chromosome segregation ATPase
MISHKSKEKLQGFLQESEDLRLGAPVQGTVHEYEQHSGGILDTLMDMEEKAQGQLSDLRKAEMEAQFSYQMVKQGLEDEMKLLKTRLSDNTGAKAANAEVLGKAKGELAYTTQTKQAYEARLQGQTTECQSKTAEWTRRQKEAGEEMAVIDKAKEILAEGVKSFFQAKTAVETVGHEDKEEELRDRLAETFKGLSKKFGSYALAQMVSSARADPFGRIRGLINDMIEKLSDRGERGGKREGLLR